MTPLRPLLSPDDIWPADAAYFARTDLASTGLVGLTHLNLDTITAQLLGLLGQRPAVRHLAGATPPILAALRDAGLPLDEDTRTYTTLPEAEAQAETLLAAGFRFISPYPLPEGRWPDAAQVVPPALWQALNAKSRLADLVPPDHLPRREVADHAAARLRAFDAPVWVKSGGTRATGAGFAVRRAVDPAAYLAALDDLVALGDPGPVVIEEDIPVVTCWAVQLGITDAGTQWGGASEQLFARPGLQNGTLVDPANPFPDPALAIAIGNTARARGFRGLAGLDIGLTPDGRLVVFDPNFRLTSSTMQVMFSDAASTRSGLPVTLSAHVASPLPMDRIIDLIRDPVSDGWFMPTRLVDATLLPAAEGQSIVTGFTLGHSRADAMAARDRLTARLAV